MVETLYGGLKMTNNKCALEDLQRVTCFSVAC